MKKTKIIFYILFIFLISLIVLGCSNYNELNNVMIIDGMGIEKKDDYYLVSFNSYLEDDEYEVIEVKVNSLEEAFNDVYLSANKKIYLSHLNILFLSSNLSNSDIIDIFNAFNNRSDLRGTFLVVMVNNYDKDIFVDDSLKVVNLINNNYLESGDVYKTDFNDIISDYLDLDISYIPIINHDLTIMGMHSLFSEFRYYNLSEAKYLNLIHDKLTSLTFTTEQEEITINNINIDYSVNKNNITIKINMLYTSNLSDKEIRTYLEDNIYFLLNLDINNNYFLDIIKRKNYYYFSNNTSLDIKFNLDIHLNKDNINNMKEDDLFEENS